MKLSRGKNRKMLRLRLDYTDSSYWSGSIHMSKIFFVRDIVTWITLG